MISFFAQALYNDIHDFWNHGWEPLEDFINNVVSNLLKLRVRVLNEFKSWVSQPLQLRGHQVDEHVDRWESR